MSTLATTTARLQLTCSVITSPEQLEELAPAWQDLLERSSANEPVLSPIWMIGWWRVFGQLDGRQLCVACFHDGGRLAGLAPLLHRRVWYRPGIPFHRLEPLGTGERPEDAVYPEYLNIIAERGLEKEVASTFARALTEGALGRWDELVMPQLDGESVLVPALTASLERAGVVCQQATAGSASYLTLPPSWEEYLQQLPSSRRAYIRQSLRRFERWADSDASYRCATTPAQLAEGKMVLAALHENRWGSGHGKFHSPRFSAFHDGVMTGLLRADALELLWLSVRGEPVAALYNIVWNHKVYFYQSGRKMDVPAGIRPGIVLHAHAIQRAIAAGRREYDFLSGGEHYKGSLALAARPLVHFRAARPSLVELAHRVAERGVGWARCARNGIRAGVSYFRPGRKVEADQGASRSTIQPEPPDRR
jgi:CelD/BcsL family acetyltransferase involved in cellulose biosynthesis